MIGTAAAILLPMTEYEQFLLMIGGLFVPLLGVLVSEYLIRERRGGFDLSEFYESAPKVRWTAVAAWIAGAAMYFVIANLFPELGASIPSFAFAAFLNSAARILKR